MPITKKRLRRLPPYSRELGHLVNDLEKAARRCRRMIETFQVIERQIRDYQIHLQRLREKHGLLDPKD